MTQYGFYFNATRCTGCKACALACKDYHDLPETLALRNVLEYGGGSWSQDGAGAWSTDTFTYYLSIACNHCDNPACVAACPQGAYERDEQTGIVRKADPEKCIGCGTCAEACPYGAPIVDPQVSKAIKCDGCLARVQEGKAPVCVEACPMRAIEVGPIEELRAAHGDLSAVAPLPGPELTAPNFVLSEPCGAQPVDGGTGELRNSREIA